MTESPLHSVSVAGVTLDSHGRVLLIKRRDNHQWQAPGGVLELSETFEDGVTREVFEETGVHVEVERLTGVYKNLPRGVVALVYRCHAVEGTPTKCQESEDVAWVDLGEVDKRMTPAFAIRVKDATSLHNVPPASRAHDGTNLL